MKWTSSLLEATHKILPAVKFQSSFFEALGTCGHNSLKASINQAKEKGFITVLDAKRCDISSTMEAYGYSAFEDLKADALTVISYMGADVVRPLYPWMRKGHGIYSVYLSSNHSGYKNQSLTNQDKGPMMAQFFHQELMDEVDSLKLTDSFGLVIGIQAYKEKSQELSLLEKKYNFLMPGMGFQGGQINSKIREIEKNQSSYLLPMSRSLSGLGDSDAMETLNHMKDFDEYQDFVENRVLAYQKLMVNEYD